MSEIRPFNPAWYTGNDVGPFTSWMVESYVPGVANPANVAALIRLLSNLTDEAESEGRKKALGFARQQWLLDLEAWKERLATYEEVSSRLARTAPGDTQNEELWRLVIEPVVQGYFPGIEARRTPDGATPLILAHQVDVASEAMDQAADMFWADLQESLEELTNAPKTLGLWALAGLAVGALAGAVISLVQKDR
jgi:hypothetical protein